MAKIGELNKRFPNFGLILLIAAALSIPLFVWSLNNAPTQTTQYAAQDYSSLVIVNQTDLVYGSSVSFTEVFPDYATLEFKKTKYPGNPLTEIKCWQSQKKGAEAYDQLETVIIKQKLSDIWWQGLTGSLTLKGNTQNVWDKTKPADCTASLFYIDGAGNFHTLSTTWFSVGPN